MLMEPMGTLYADPQTIGVASVADGLIFVTLKLWLCVEWLCLLPLTIVRHIVVIVIQRPLGLLMSAFLEPQVFLPHSHAKHALLCSSFAFSCRAFIASLFGSCASLIGGNQPSISPHFPYFIEVSFQFCLYLRTFLLPTSCSLQSSWARSYSWEVLVLLWVLQKS